MSADGAALRAERRGRVLAEMERAGLDVLLLGREGNVRYVTGAHRLWLAGMRGWAPACVVVRRTGAAHLLSITDAGLPPEIAPERLYPITWNPMNLLGAIAAIDGVDDATTIGVDGSTPMMRDLIGGVLPGAHQADGAAALAAARRIKTDAEIERIRAAVGVARSAVAAGAEQIEAGGEPSEIEGAVRRRAAELGSTAVSAPVEITPWSVQASVLVEGYEGCSGWVSDGLADRVEPLRHRLREPCRRPGARSPTCEAPTTTPARLRRPASWPEVQGWARSHRCSGAQGPPRRCSKPGWCSRSEPL